jgi:outer membrane murein-binding lipoprotein Lpp
MKAKHGRLGLGVLAVAFVLMSGCATQDQVDQLSNEMQQLRAQAALRDAQNEALAQRLAQVQQEVDREGPSAERAQMLEALNRLVESNESLRASLAHREGGPSGDAETRQALGPAAGGDEAESRHLVRQLRQIVYGRGALTSTQQLLLLRALRPQRELDRDSPWEPPNIDRTNPWEPKQLDRGNPWHLPARRNEGGPKSRAKSTVSPGPSTTAASLRGPD